MKKIFYVIGLLLLAGILAGCSEAADPMTELLKDPYGDYQEKGGEIAFVYDGNLNDGSCNEAIYEGIRMYALAAGISFSYYGTENDSPEERTAAIERAADSQARIIICAGCDFQEAVAKLQGTYPELSFLLIDGSLMDEEGNPIAIEKNVHVVSFQEEESGYLAGYMAVWEGYHSLGFIGGREDPPVIRYGYGFLQGIQDAARDGKLEDVTVNYWYSGSFLPTQETEEMAEKWYAEGTEVIFACGGALYESVLKAAERGDGMLIGADVDQGSLSGRFLTSAVKDLAGGVIISLDDYYASGGKWSSVFAGKSVRYGVGNRCVGIPVTDTGWRFENVTKDDFFQVYQRIRSGEIRVSNAIGKKPRVDVTVNYVQAQKDP